MPKKHVILEQKSQSSRSATEKSVSDSKDRMSQSNPERELAQSTDNSMRNSHPLNRSMSKLNLRTTPTFNEYWQQAKVISGGIFKKVDPETPSPRDRQRARLHEVAMDGKSPVSGVNIALGKEEIPLNEPLCDAFIAQHKDHAIHDMTSPRSIAHEKVIQRRISKHLNSVGKEIDEKVATGAMTPEAMERYRKTVASNTVGLAGHFGLAAVKATLSKENIDEHQCYLDIRVEEELNKIKKHKP